MGQKVHPVGFRLGATKTWSSKWFDSRDYAKSLHEDLKIRKEIDSFYKNMKDDRGKGGSSRKDSLDAAISEVEIVRFPKKRIHIFISTARAGVVIGPKGVRVEALKTHLQKLTDMPVQVSIREIKQQELDASIVAQSIAKQLENRASFRRTMKQAINQAIRSGGKGIKITVSGRLGGADMARTETYKEGSIPLHTLRADIDYGFAEAATTYGIIGVKVWLHRGEITKDRRAQQDDAGKIVSSMKGE